MPDDPRLADLVKSAEEREDARKKAQSSEDPTQHKQAVIQFRKRVAAVLSQEVRDALQLTYGWNTALGRPRAVFHIAHPTQGRIACDLIELESADGWRVWMPNPYHPAQKLTSAELTDGLLLAIGSFKRLEF